MLLTPNDFSNNEIPNVNTNPAIQNILQYVIDKEEARYIEYINEDTNNELTDEAIKEILKYFIRYEYIMNIAIKQTDTGVTTTESSTGSSVDFGANIVWNKGVRLLKSYQEHSFCEVPKNGCNLTFRTY